MKKTKILTVLGVLLAMGITACAGGNESSESVAPTPTSETPVPSSETPVPSSETPAPVSSVVPTTSSVAPTTSSKTPTTSSQTPASSSQTPSSSVEPPVPTKSVSYTGSTYLKGADGKLSLVINGTQSSYTSADFNFAFGLTKDGSTFIVGKAAPEDADYKYVPEMGDAGAFSLTIALEDLEGLDEGEFSIYLGPKGAYADATSSLNIESGTKSGLKYRFGTRDDDHKLQVSEIPPISFTDAFIQLDGGKPVLYFGGAFIGSEQDILAKTPWLQVQSVGNGWGSTTYGYENGFEQWGDHDLVPVMKVIGDKAYVTADVSELPNASYHAHFSMKGTVKGGEAIMENAIDQSNAKVRYNGKDYWCWSNPADNSQASLYGHLGFVVAPAKFNVTPNLNYEGAPAMDPIAVNNGKITLPADPTREGYSFVGWFDAATGGNQVDNDTVYNDDTTIYAHWADHVHSASATWEYNETKHWQKCVAAGCPIDGYKMNEADHTFGDVTPKTPATCTADGVGEVECTVCSYKKDVVIPAAHSWGTAQTIPAGEGQVAYELFTCSACGLLKADVKASAGTITGTNKSGTPEGYIKLTSNGDVVTWKINVPGSSPLAGTLYQRGVMDSWNSNKNTTYSQSGTGNQGTNFVITVNGNEVDMSATKNASYESMLKDGVVDSSLNNYSPIADCPIGTIELQPGENVITYKRLASYNLTISDLIFIGKAHTHVAASEWSKDANQHWHVCTGANCPVDGLRMDAADHTWGEQYDIVPATCDVKGSYKVKCAVCDFVKTVETDKVDHTWGEAQTPVSDATPHECSTCQTMSYELAVASPEKLKKDLTWNITGLPAGEYEIQLYACAASTTLTQKYDNRYQFKVDSGDYIGASDNNATYASYGLGTGEALANCQWSKAINQITIGADAASFTIHWTNVGYSAFIAGIRLVKVA